MFNCSLYNIPVDFDRRLARKLRFVTIIALLGRFLAKTHLSNLSNKTASVWATVHTNPLQKRCFSERSSNWNNLATPAFRFRVDGKHCENDDRSIIMWLPAQIQNNRWFLRFHIRPVWFVRKTFDAFSEWNLRFQILPARCMCGRGGASCLVTYSFCYLLLSTTASLGRPYPRNGTNEGKQPHCENSQLKATSVWWVLLTRLGPNTKHMSVNYKPVTWKELNCSFSI